MKKHLINKKIKIFTKRLIISIIIIISLSLALLARLFYLQSIKHSYYTHLSTRNAISVITIPTQRGLIYDRHGTVIANNKLVYNLIINPRRTHNLAHTLNKLNQIIPMTAIEKKLFYQKLKKTANTQDMILKTNLSVDEVAKFSVNKWQLQGAHLEKELIRNYPYGALFAHVIGYVSHQRQKGQNLNLNQIDISHLTPKTAIEKYYQAELAGKPGKIQVEINASGKKIQRLKQQAIPGDNLYLTIDTQLQQFISEKLAKRAGAVVVVAVNSGQILALVSSPSFNANLFVQGIDDKNYHALVNQPHHPLYDRATSGLYSPGSTIKPFFALSALNYHIIKPSYTIFDPGYFQLPNNNHIYHDWKIGGHGFVNVKKAIMESCDTFFFNLGYLMGIKLMHQTLADFGFGEKTGIDLPYEAKGVNPSPKWKMASYGKHWYLGDTVNLAIGQGYLLVTPIQLALATETLANHGKKQPLHLLLGCKRANKAETDCLQGTKKTTKTTSLATKLLNKQAWQVVHNAMHELISKMGVAWGFGIPKNYSVAAKTGTAQVSSHRFKNNRYTHVSRKLRPDSWILVFAPNQHPKIALVVLVEHSPGEAAPLARKITDYFFSHEQQIMATAIEP